MAKLPRIPPEWNDQSAASQHSDLDLNILSSGILDGWQEPGWRLENSGLGLLLHPQIIGQIDFDEDSSIANSISDHLQERTNQFEPSAAPLNIDASFPHIDHVAGKALRSISHEPTMEFTVPIVEIPAAKLDDLGPLPPLLPPRVPYSPSPFEKGMNTLGRGPVGKAWNQFSDVVHDALRSEWGDRILTALEKTAQDSKDVGDWAEKAGMGWGTYGTVAGKNKYINLGNRGMESGAYLQGFGDIIGAPAALGRAIQKDDKTPIYRWLNEAAKPGPENPFKKRRP